ncbi:hypothetical protein PVAND_005291 [Polypedilum vanderplanki]|uniref:Uncharacterized protein n=1 Tax=Polypedilum vanderplanki TaxID=319348 RepID=A0A9J6BZY9_POLVA|nr:hypothetical protein PVAND_005291 [Polypedilum vanderplanki]
MSPENKNILEKSTIHGIGYIFDKNEKILVRLLWFIIFILSNVGFGFYAYNIYMKWTFEPDILVREKSKLLTDIPFPAVTICSPLFAKNQLANLAQFELKFREKKYNVYPNLSQSEINYMTSNIQTCDLNYLLKLERFYRRRDNNDVLKLLDESFRSIDEVLFGCRRNGAKDRCKKVFIRMITHRGFCYTFNIQGHSVIFNNEDLSSAFDYPNVTAAIDVYPKSLNINELNFTKWSLDKEFLDYKFNNIRFLYPLRAKVERNAYQNIYMFINASDTNNLCWSFAKSFSFYIHLPNEILSPLHKEYSVQLGTGKLLTLSAQSFRSDESLRSYSPEIRDCYFEGERKLQFFKAYTKLNCEYECMVNYTLNQCKCIMFYMPRKSASKVCDYENYSCFIKSLADWHKETSKNKTCNCLNTCNNIEYKVAYERTSNLDNSDPEIYF